MYKEKLAFMEDFFQESSRNFRETNVFSMNRGLLDLPISQIQNQEEMFLNKYLISKSHHDSAMNFVQSHFVREFQDEELHRIKLT